DRGLVHPVLDDRALADPAPVYPPLLLGRRRTDGGTRLGLVLGHHCSFVPAMAPPTTTSADSASSISCARCTVKRRAISLRTSLTRELLSRRPVAAWK